MEEIIESVVNESNKESEDDSLYSDDDQNRRGIFPILFTFITLESIS
jgi:hypothetical protein